MNVLVPCLPYIDFFLPSIDEARMITKKEDPKDIAEYLHLLGIRKFIGNFIIIICEMKFYLSS